MEWPAIRKVVRRKRGRRALCGAVEFRSTAIYGDMASEEDIQAANEMAVQFGNHEAFWHWDPATVEFPVYTIYNGDAISWTPKKAAMHTAPVNMIYPLEDIIIK